jgi:hypothetical protein
MCEVTPKKLGIAISSFLSRDFSSICVTFHFGIYPKPEFLDWDIHPNREIPEWDGVSTHPKVECISNQNVFL